MIRGWAQWFSRLPTAAKLLLILTAVLLPIGLALIWVAESGIREANQALRGRTQDQAEMAARSMDSLIARNVLALRIAANGALTGGAADACARAERSLAIAPAVARRFALEDGSGRPLCAVGDFAVEPGLPLVAPGAIRIVIAERSQSLILRIGVVGGILTTALPAAEFRGAIREPESQLASVLLRDDERQLAILDPGRRDTPGAGPAITEWQLANGQMVAHIGAEIPRIATIDRLLLLLPLLMWVTAALVTWLLVNRLLIRPLRTLDKAVVGLQPGETAQSLPRRLGPAREIQHLRDSFARSLERIEQSEREMSAALDGQRRLVREVHHRVKNNLQVVASLLNIHGRTAETPEARAAYAAIGRRVGALSIVHHNHFAEMEETRGIALRPLLAELSAELRAGTPEAARGLSIELELDNVYTTQDVAVSVAFLITEIVEFAMLNQPEVPVEVSLRRSSELTARLTLASPVLVPDEGEAPGNMQFERIISGLAKQLRSALDRKLGRYSVDLPVFPAA